MNKSYEQMSPFTLNSPLLATRLRQSHLFPKSPTRGGWIVEWAKRWLSRLYIRRILKGELLWVLTLSASTKIFSLFWFFWFHCFSYFHFLYWQMASWRGSDGSDYHLHSFLPFTGCQPLYNFGGKEKFLKISIPNY